MQTRILNGRAKRFSVYDAENNTLQDFLSIMYLLTYRQGSQLTRLKKIEIIPFRKALHMYINSALTDHNQA